MTFNKYKVRPLQRFTSSLWNALMDELNNLQLGAGVISDIEAKVAELYDADATEEQSVVLNVGGYKVVGVVAVCDEPTTFTVEYSFDEDHWFTHYVSPYPETNYSDVFITVAKYVRVLSEAVNVQGAKVSIIIGAKP